MRGAAHGLRPDSVAGLPAAGARPPSQPSRAPSRLMPPLPVRGATGHPVHRRQSSRLPRLSCLGKHLPAGGSSSLAGRARQSPPPRGLLAPIVVVDNLQKVPIPFPVPPGQSCLRCTSACLHSLPPGPESSQPRLSSGSRQSPGDIIQVPGAKQVGVKQDGP